jgi:hypothetical protein
MRYYSRCQRSIDKVCPAIKHPGTGEEMFKARLVVKGCQYKFKKFLVRKPNNVRAGSLNILMAIASMCGFADWSEDFTQAFVQSAGNMKRDV